MTIVTIIITTTFFILFAYWREDGIDLRYRLSFFSFSSKESDSRLFPSVIDNYIIPTVCNMNALLIQRYEMHVDLLRTIG